MYVRSVIVFPRLTAASSGYVPPSLLIYTRPDGTLSGIQHFLLRYDALRRAHYADFDM
jgi:hypothetical protein